MAARLPASKQTPEIPDIEQALDLIALNTESGWIKLSRQEEMVYGVVINFCRQKARQMARQYFHKTEDPSIISAQAIAKKLDRRSTLVELERRFFFKIFPQAITKRIISATKPFIISQAQHYHNLDTLAEFHDLVTAGILGMFEAIRIYDYQRGCTFLTLAKHWIQEYIQREITDRSYGFYARPPEYLSVTRYQIQEFTKKFKLQHGREPTDREILKQSGIKVSGKELTKSHVEQVKRFVSIAYPTRLDETCGHRDKPLGKSTPEPSTDIETSPENRLIAREELQARLKDLEADWLIIEEAMNSAILDLRSKRSIRRQKERLQNIAEARVFGLSDDPSATLREIGARFSIGRERVRQEEERLLGMVSRITGLSTVRIRQVCLQMNRWREAQTVLEQT